MKKQNINSAFLLIKPQNFLSNEIYDVGHKKIIHKKLLCKPLINCRYKDLLYRKVTVALLFNSHYTMTLAAALLR
ncbi:hypothetical protein D8M09_18885 [Enterobacter sp. R1(2018)]|nr:hypothetical protein D8M09_18885 [Enterobacter sp. R1(2018)]